MSKKQRHTKTDNHKSKFMVRLPESHRENLQALKRLHRRPTTVEIQIALEAHYLKHGLPIPDQSS